MPHISTTKTSLVQEYVNSKHIKKNFMDTRENNINDINKPKEVNVYDETCPKHELFFMYSVRKWEKSMGFKTALRWMNIIPIAAHHLTAVAWMLYNIVMNEWCKYQTYLFVILIAAFGGFGVTAGAHRLWTHRSYKAKWPLEVILTICFSTAGQNNIYNWVRDHRVHHKYSETRADPHDVQRGFFFAHIGWLMMKKHPHVIREGEKIDMSDITSNPIIQFHTRYFHLFRILFCYLIPVLVPVFAWTESWKNAIYSQVFLRYTLGLNSTWSVNSFAHIWGNRPYDRNIKPTENWAVSIAALGEGWHNYHHTFPWDYKASELPYQLNPTTFILDQFAKIGWAYDMKQASSSLIKAVAERRGEPHHTH